MKKLILTCLAIAAFAILFAPGTALAWKNLPHCYEACGCGTPCQTRCAQGFMSSTTCFNYGTCRDLCYLRPNGGGDDNDTPPAERAEARFIELLNDGAVEKEPNQSPVAAPTISIEPTAIVTR